MTFTTRNGFRILVVIGLITMLAAIVAAATKSLLPEYAQVVFDSTNSKSAPVYMAGLALLSIIVTIFQFIATIGILFFKRWARITYVALQLLSILITPLFDVQIFSGLAGALGSLAGLITGMTVALMFVSPVSGYFNGNTGS